MAVRLNEWQLRGLFNQSGIWERAVAGELVCHRVSRTPDPGNLQPPGTISVTTTIFDPQKGSGLFGLKVAVTHHYENPDGSIRNKAGRPDPKLVRTDQGVFVLG